MKVLLSAVGIDEASPTVKFASVDVVGEPDSVFEDIGAFGHGGRRSEVLLRSRLLNLPKIDFSRSCGDNDMQLLATTKVPRRRELHGFIRPNQAGTYSVDG